MDYTIKTAAISGDCFPALFVATSMARAKATAYGNIPFLKQRFDSSLKDTIQHVIGEIIADRLKVCDMNGAPVNANDFIEEAKKSGNLPVSKRYIVEPDWERLSLEIPEIVLGSGVRDFSNIDLGATEIDWDCTYLNLFYVRLYHVNEWGKTRGDNFLLSHEGVEWIEGWTDKTGKLEVTVFGSKDESTSTKTDENLSALINKDDEIRLATNKLNDGLKKVEKQIRAIEDEIKKLGYDPKCIPIGGKKNLMKACKNFHSILFGHGDEPFKTAWKAARKQNRLEMKDNKKFSGQ